MYNLDLVSVQEVRWDKGRTIRAGNYICFYGKERKSSIGNRIFVHHGRVSPLKRVEFVSDRMSYAVLKRLLV
jgi:hypothetical protein